MSAPVAISAVLVTGPTAEPVTPEEAKAQARVTGADSDDLIASYITAAREEAEDFLNYGLLTQTWRADLAEFADVIPLPRAMKLQSITHVKYYDVNGTLQTLSSTYYEMDTVSRPARLVRAADMSWPALQADRRIGRVQVTYVIGWTSAALVPERIKHGIKMYVSYLDADRDGMDAQASAARVAAERCWSDRLWDLPVVCE